MFVLFLACHFDECLFGLPVFLLELVHYRGVLALNKAVEIVPRITTENKDIIFNYFKFSLFLGHHHNHVIN